MDEAATITTVRRYRRLKYLIHSLQVFLAFSVGMAVWLVGFTGRNGTAAVW